MGHLPCELQSATAFVDGLVERLPLRIDTIQTDKGAGSSQRSIGTCLTGAPGSFIACHATPPGKVELSHRMSREEVHILLNGRLINLANVLHDKARGWGASATPISRMGTSEAALPRNSTGRNVD